MAYDVQPHSWFKRASDSQVRVIIKVDAEALLWFLDRFGTELMRKRAGVERAARDYTRWVTYLGQL